jgi:uncharacterized membrane protein
MNFLQRLRTTLVAGLFLLLPIAVVGIIAIRTIAILHPITERIAAYFGITTGGRTLTIILLLLLCLLSGFLMRSQRVSHVRDWLERNVLNLLPGYEYIRMRMNETLAQGADQNTSAVLVRFDDNWSPARLIETGEDGTSVVFIPDTPQGNSGAVLVVESDRVQHLNVPYAKLAESVRNYGKGLQALKAGNERAMDR